MDRSTDLRKRRFRDTQINLPHMRVGTDGGCIALGNQRAVPVEQCEKPRFARHQGRKEPHRTPVPLFGVLRSIRDVAGT